MEVEVGGGLSLAITSKTITKKIRKVICLIGPSLIQTKYLTASKTESLRDRFKTDCTIVHLKLLKLLNVISDSNMACPKDKDVTEGN